MRPAFFGRACQDSSLAQLPCVWSQNLKSRSSRRWLFLSCVVALAALAVPVASALAQAGQAALNICLAGNSQSCPDSFRIPPIFAPASGEAGQSAALFNLILITAALVFVLVEGMLIASVLRFRNRSPEIAMQFRGSTALEIVWTAAPGVILAVLLGFTLKTMSDVKAVTSENVLNVEAIGRQWWWEFRYPDLNLVMADELVVPIGATIEVAVESVDVAHSFWSPELFGKVDSIPGQTMRVRFTPTAIGTYGGQCAQYCGTQHAQMRFAVKVVSAQDFLAWAANQPAVSDHTHGH